MFCFLFFFFPEAVHADMQAAARSTLPARARACVCVGEVKDLLLVVSPTVQFGVSAEAGGGERLLARDALQTLLVPGRVVDPHQEAV